MSKAFFPGTFDPPTLGHLDIIERAQKVCPDLVIGVAEVTHKTGQIFSVEERVSLLQELTSLEVVSFTGLAVDKAKELGATFLLRSLRNELDFTHEFQMAAANKKLSGLETLFLMSEMSHISSTLIREIGHCDHDLSQFVPKAIEEQVRSRL